jgi:hypothetical protein
MTALPASPAGLNVFTREGNSDPEQTRTEKRERTKKTNGWNLHAPPESAGLIFRAGLRSRGCRFELLFRYLRFSP